MTTKTCLVACLVVAAGCLAPVAAQSVRHIQAEGAGIASGVWVGDMLYLSGQLPTPVTPADRAKGTPAVYGNTREQSESTFRKIENLLKAQGLGMGDVVMMRVYMAADPAMGNTLDFAGMNAAYATFFGTPEQPNKPARSTVQVAALVAQGALVEIEVQAARHATAAASGTSSSAGVFTAQQASAGKAVFGKACAHCHMPDLSGNNEVPPLAGALFLGTWGGRTTKELFDYVSGAMPPGGPAQTSEAYESIVAYILHANGVPGGSEGSTARAAAPLKSLIRAPTSN